MRPLQLLFVLSFLANSTISQSQLVINEIMATNASGLIETDFYNFPDWIEIYNSGSSSINLEDYHLSDDNAELYKWQLPAKSLAPGEYYIAYCDKEAVGDHTNFGLSAGGESVYLSNAGGTVHTMKFDKQFPNVSFGKSTSDSLLYYCATPTPGQVNLPTTAYELAPKAEFSLPAGRSSSSVSLSLTGNDVRYSSDGSEPDSSSVSYSGPINISKTTVVKTKNYLSGFLPGEPSANTYFINEHEFTIPVVSLSFTPDYFYDNTIGIYVVGTNGTEGNCGSMRNWNQNWERAAYLEYFDNKGIKQLSQPVGVKVAGGCTRGRDQKSLSIYARSKYGDNDFDFPIFSEKPHIDSYKSILLRNSGNDQDQTLMRDAIIQALVKPTMDIDCQAYQPTSVYMNGEYFGIMNLREKTDEDYFLSNYNLKSDEIDFLEVVLWADETNCYNAIRGSLTDYQNIISFITENSLDSNENYSYVASQLDLQEYINYMTVQIYIGNRDWPGNNTKFWKKKEDGKWRWILFDTDYGFGFRFSDGGADFESFHLITEENGGDHPNPPWSTLLFRKLIENESFKKQFLSTFITHMYSSFDPEWCSYNIDSLSNVIDDEIAYNQALYGRTKNQWQEYLNTMKTYAVNRQAFMPDYVKSFFSMDSDEVEITVLNPYPQEGKVELNHATLPLYPFTMTSYKDLPVSIKALPSTGYFFSHWEYSQPGESFDSNMVLESDTSYNFTITPVFEAIKPIDPINGIYLNEIASVSKAYKDDFRENSGYVELYNSTNKDVQLVSCFLSDTKTNLIRYSIPNGTIIPAKGFTIFYADGQTFQGTSHTPFEMDEDGGSILLSQKIESEVNIIDSASYTYLTREHSYGKYADGTGQWQEMTIQTPGLANDPSGPMLRIENPVFTSGLSIYPNPSQGSLFINFDQEDISTETLSCQLVDISGRFVLSTINIDSQTTRIDMNGLKDGFYFIRLLKGSQIVATRKIILLR